MLPPSPSFPPPSMHPWIPPPPLADSPMLIMHKFRNLSPPSHPRGRAILDAPFAQALFVDLLEALALDPGDASSGFGFIVSAAKAPSPSDSPKLLVKHPADVSHAVASGETLFEVDGFKTAGMTAREVKEIVSRASIRVRLCVQKAHGEPRRNVTLWRGWARGLVALSDRVKRDAGGGTGGGGAQVEASVAALTRALSDCDTKVNPKP